ncbi:hypothetical protein SBV1_1740036 [Verrucomicrobia bacterium]|nr:hypothetical protein SBV1_1740036 [Verrucomicrobiota bacterium]
MSKQEIAEAVMGLPEKDRLELARQIIAGLIVEQEASEAIARALPGLEDVVRGKVRGLTEAEFRDALR